MLHFIKMKQNTSILLVLTFSSFFFSQAVADGLNIPELFTTLNSTVYIPCNVGTGIDHEYMTPISWTRVAYDGFVEKMMAPNFLPPSIVDSYPSYLNSYTSLVVKNMVHSLSGTYTCHTDKGNASTLVHVLDGGDCHAGTSVHVLDGESQNSPSPCSENFDLVHGKCLYYSNEKKTWREATYDCELRTSSLITFKDVKDLMSFLLNLQNSGPTHYQLSMWTGHAYFDESGCRFGSLQNDPQVSPMLYNGHARLSSCGYLSTVKRAAIFPTTSAECDSVKFNFLCEQPTL